MPDPMQGRLTQLANIEKKTGRSLKELTTIVARSGLQKHGEIRDWLKKELGLGHGDANSLALYARESAAGGGAPESTESLVDGYYSGAKAALRPIHDKVMAAIAKFGEFEIAPKKTYLSLRRKKQFAMVGPATNTRVEIGLNMQGVPPTDRLVAVPQPAMCKYKVKLTSASEVDSELIGWIRRAFDSSN